MGATVGEFLEFPSLYADQTEAVIRARWDAWANEGLTPDQTDQWTDTREGSFFHVCTQPGVREAARIYDLMGTEVPSAASPLWAWDTYLDDHAEVQNVFRLVATRSEGYVTFSGPPTTLIPTGVVVGVEPASDSADALEYETTGTGTIPAAAAAPTGLAAVLAAGGALTAGTTYRYVVTAVDAAGETVASAEVSAAPAAGNLKVSLDWNDVATATSYRVYRRTGIAGPPWDYLNEVTVSAYVDDGAIATDAAKHPPVVNGTGGKLRLPIRATVPGADHNVSVGAITQMITPINGVSPLNAASVVGGTDVESDTGLRQRLLDRYVGQGAGNRADYIRWAGEEPGVGRVTVIALWNGPGTVKVIVTDPQGRPVSASVVSSLQTRLDPVPGKGEGEAPIGATVTVTTATSLPIKVDATVEMEPGYTLTGFGGTVAIGATIQGVVKRYVESVPSGGEVVRAQVVSRIAAVQGVHDVNIGTVALNDALVNIAVPSEPARVPQISSINLLEGTF